MGATAQVLRDLPAFNDPNVLIGANLFDDAGVYRLDESTALVQTVDFFPPLVDEPYPFGQIAAANAVSDIYAMGARPLTALNIVGYPDDKLPLSLLSDILRGGAERMRAAGAAIIGGHSVRDTEIKYGLAVTGVVDPARILSNAGARPGDRLVLSKPIGSGVLTSAAKAGKITPENLAEAIEVMIELNAGACQAAIDAGAHAMTDVTGFGLLGHAFEMAEGSRATIELDTSAVPLLEGTRTLAERRLLTRAYKSNLESIGDRLEVGESVDATLVNVLADAQTSGGLLIAIPEDRTDQLIEALRTHRTKCAVAVGQVTARADRTIRLR